jgi:hypothetical protein
MTQVPSRSPDTTAAAEQVQVELFRQASAGRRVRIALSLSAAVIGAARLGIARANPELSARDRDLLFVELHYGRELAEALRADFACRDAMRREGP